MEVDNKLKEFLENEDNRKNAEDKAVQLWIVLTGNKPIETAAETRFTQTQVVHKTNLSHSKTNQLINLLRAFGFLEWTEIKKREFVLHFDRKKCYEIIRTEIISVVESVKSDIIRYKTAIEADDSITAEDRDKALARLKDDIDDLLRF